MSSTEPTRPDDLERVVGDTDAADAVAAQMEEADLRNGEPGATSDDAGADTTTATRPHSEPPGTDTRTGTDPDATYDHPGYEDKSFGQAVEQDRGLAEQLLDETDGDADEAARRFDQESAGAPTIARQHGADETAAESTP
jgi:hypothetical protein